jgi:DNA-binding transcriptional MerR regulator
MLRIGDFARLGRVSVATLRHYDDVGLLHPIRVDQESGYRYYAYDQLRRLNRILALRDVGVSLEGIAPMLGEDIPIAELRRLLQLRQSELQSQMEEEQSRLARLAARLRILEEEGPESAYETILKPATDLLVASQRGLLTTQEEQSRLWETLSAFLGKHDLAFRPPFYTIYHAEEPAVDAEVCVGIPALIPPEGGIEIRVLAGAAQMASTVHHGSFRTIDAAYRALFRWIDQCGLATTGPVRQIVWSLEMAEKDSKMDAHTVTEIQVPVEKI